MRFSHHLQRARFSSDASRLFDKMFLVLAGSNKGMVAFEKGDK